jgi:tRNA(Phe) wybutosine-synthesizing methylase Tyw3
MPLRRKTNTTTTTAAIEKANNHIAARDLAKAKRHIEQIDIICGSKETAISTIELKLKYADEDGLSSEIVDAYREKLAELTA